MLLHDNCIFCVVKFEAVVKFHCTLKCINNILYFKCIFVMAESDKTLTKHDNFSNNNRKASTPSIVPHASGTLHNDKSSIPNATTSEPSTLKRKQTSFQITSVTVKGSRLSTDGGEDSADDLDESHTEDASSDILDCSRTTDVDNDQLSEDTNNTTNNDDASIPAPSIPLESKVHLPIKKIAQNNALLFPSESSQIEKLDIPLGTSQNVKPPTLPDQWQHRFRVVKIVSSVPFKRGRWLCMDFMDPPAPVVEAKPESIDASISSGMLPESIPADRVAHVYEIPPGDAYPGTLSMVIRPDERLQPMYGIFLPISNGQYPLMAGMNSKAIGTPIHSDSKTQESTQSISSTQSIQHQSNASVTQSTNATQAIQHQKLVSNIQTGVPTQGSQLQTNIPVSSNPPTVSTHGFPPQQNIPSNQSILPTQGISHQVNVSAVSTQVGQHTATNTLSPISNQTVHQTVTNIQSVASNLGNQHILSNTQSSVNTQTIQQMSITNQCSQVIQPVTSVLSTPQVIPQNLPVTQPVIPPCIQQNIAGEQPTISGQHSQSVNIQSQSIQHSQNLVGGLVSGMQESALSVQGIPQQIESNVAGLSVDHNKVSVCQANQGIQSAVAQKQEIVSQVVPQITPSTPPQSQTATKNTSNVAMSQQTSSAESVPHVMSTSVTQIQTQQAVESQQIQIVKSSNSQATLVPPTTQMVDSTPQPSAPSSGINVEHSQTLINQEVMQTPLASVPIVGTATAINTADINVVTQPQETIVPSQVIPNHVDVKELGTPPSGTGQESSQDIPPSKSDINGEESESVPSGTSTVAIDNKIEQAMDLVKSHLMFAVREEVDVLKEKITELMDRINQLEYENGFLRANASQQTLEQLNQTQLLQQQQQQQQQQLQNQPAAVLVNSVPQVTQPSSQQLNVQDQQPTS